MIRPSMFATAAWLMSAPIVTVLPAQAQDAPTPASGATQAVAVSQPLDDRKPATGKSIIRFPDHQFEIDGKAGVTVSDGHPWLFLPAGAPALPVGPAAVHKQADGSTFYDAQMLGKLSVFSTSAPKPPSVLPERFRESIVPNEAGATAGSGVRHTGDVILSIPYSYKYPVRLDDDFAAHGLFGTTALGARGETGFDAGQFRGARGDQTLLCLFNPKQADTYAEPDCYAETLTPLGSLTLEKAKVDNNIPRRFIQSRNIFAGVKPPSIATTGVTIDHPFHLELVMGAWTQKGLGYSWRSEGRTIESGTFPADAQGAGFIYLGALWLKLSRTLTGNDEMRIESVPVPKDQAPLLLPPAPPNPSRAVANGAPQIIDGIVYTPNTHASAH